MLFYWSHVGRRAYLPKFKIRFGSERPRFTMCSINHTGLFRDLTYYASRERLGQNTWVLVFWDIFCIFRMSENDFAQCSTLEMFGVNIFFLNSQESKLCFELWWLRDIHRSWHNSCIIPVAYKSRHNANVSIPKLERNTTPPHPINVPTPHSHTPHQRHS